MKNKNLLSLLKGTAQNKFGNKKITSKVSKREKTHDANIYLKKRYEDAQLRRNETVENLKDKLYKEQRRNYNVLDELGFLTMEATPYEIFDSKKEVKDRIKLYEDVIKRGVKALEEEATKGTAALIHMLDNTILYQLDENLRQNLIDRYLFASIEERMEFLKDAFKYVREYYEEIRQGFETTDGREIAENLVNLLNFRMENNSKEITDELFYDLTHR